jgi:hypothetical protein
MSRVPWMTSVLGSSMDGPEKGIFGNDSASSS